MTVVVIIAQLLAFSALSTDVAQTQQYVHCTEASPCSHTVDGRDYFFYEQNPIVAGQPEKLCDVADFLEAAIMAAPEVMPSRIAVPLLLLEASTHLFTIRTYESNPYGLTSKHLSIRYQWAF